MRQEHHKKEETVRLTVDFPVEQHIYIKMMAAKEGVSMRQYIIEHLPSPNLKDEKGTIKKRNSKIYLMKS